MFGYSITGMVVIQSRVQRPQIHVVQGHVIAMGVSRNVIKSGIEQTASIESKLIHLVENKYSKRDVLRRQESREMRNEFRELIESVPKWDQHA